MPEGGGLADLVGMEFTNRNPSQTSERSIQTGPETNGTALPDAQKAEQVPSTVPEPKPAETRPEPSSDLIADLSKQFSQTIGEVPPAEPITETPPAEAAPQAPEKKEPTWREEEAPKTFAKKAQEDWQKFKSKAVADVQAGEARIKALETELAAIKEELPKAKGQAEEVARKLQEAEGIVERVSIEKSLIFKAKVLDQESILKARLAKLLEGTGVGAVQAAHMLTGDMTQRESVLESSAITTFRKQQIADLMNKWDGVQEERDRLTSRGKESREAYLREQQEAEQARRAEFMRASAKIFEDQAALCCPKLEPYCTMEGNQDWNTHTQQLRLAARQIYDGNVTRETLAQVALLAPAAIVFQKLLQLAQQKIVNLQTQVNRLQGVSPGVRDTGGDLASPSSAPSKTPDGDFVRGLVERFRKDTGLQ
jgi:hypothetical protein